MRKLNRIDRKPKAGIRRQKEGCIGEASVV